MAKRIAAKAATSGPKLGVAWMERVVADIPVLLAAVRARYLRAGRTGIS
jgi:hypothetical protein